MKIVLATAIYPPAIGGPAWYVKNLAEGLKEAGREVAILSYGKGDSSGDLGFVSGPSIRRHLKYFLKLFGMSGNADIVYAFDPLAVGLLAYLVSKLRGIKFVMRVGGDYLWERDVEAGRIWCTLRGYYESGAWKKHIIVSFLLKRIFAGVHQFIFTTQFQADIYQKAFGIHKEKINIVPNPFVAPLAAEVARGDKIIFAGRFIKLKNLKNLIKVFKEIETDCRLVLIGDGPEKAKLMSLAKDTKIVIEPSVPHDELMRKIASARACVLPSLSEVSPNFALECLSLKTPILLTCENGLGLDLPDALLLNPVDVADLKNKLKAIIVNPDFIWGKNSLPVWSRENVINAHLDVFQK